MGPKQRGQVDRAQTQLIGQEFLWVLDIFQHNGKRQEGTAVVWRKGPAGGQQRRGEEGEGCVQRDDAVS